MSLEATINENTQAVRDLIAAIAQLGNLPTQKLEAVKLVPIGAEDEAKKAGKTPPKEDAKPAAEPEAPALDYSEVKQAVVALVTAKGPDAVREVLSKYNVASAKDLPQDRWVACLEDLRKALEEVEA